MRKEYIINEIFDSIQRNFSEAAKPLEVLIASHGEAMACRIKYNNNQQGETPEIKALSLYIISHLDGIKGSLNQKQLLELVNILTLSANYCDQESVSNTNPRETIEQIKFKVRARINAALTCLQLTEIKVDTLISEKVSSVEKGVYLTDTMKLQPHEIEIIAQFLLYYGKFSRYQCDFSPALSASKRAVYISSSQQLSDWINHTVLSSTASSVLYFVYMDLNRLSDAISLMISAYKKAMETRRAFDAVIFGCRAISGLVTAYEKSRVSTIIPEAETLAFELDNMVSEEAPKDRENLYKRLPYYNVKLELLRVKLIQYKVEEDGATEAAQSKFSSALQLWDSYFSVYDSSGHKKPGLSGTGLKASHTVTAIELFTKYAVTTEDMQLHLSILNPQSSVSPLKSSKWEMVRKVLPLVSTKKGNGPVPSVWLEALDSAHTPWKILNREREEWLRHSNAPSSLFKFFEQKRKTTGVLYSKIFGEKFAITFTDGLAYKENDLKLLSDHHYSDLTPALFDTMAYQGKSEKSTSSGYAAFILDAATKKLYSMPYISDEIHHISCTDAGRTLSAGMIKVEKGRVVGIQQMSGHFKPGGRELYQILLYLHQQGVDIRDRKLHANVEVILPFTESEYVLHSFIQEITMAIISNTADRYIKNCEYKPSAEITEEAEQFANQFQTKEQLLLLHRATGLPISEFALGEYQNTDDLEEQMRMTGDIEALKEMFFSLYTDFEFGRDSARSDKEFSRIYFLVNDRFGTFLFNTSNNLRMDLRDIIVSACVSRALLQRSMQLSGVAPAAFGCS